MLEIYPPLNFSSPFVGNVLFPHENHTAKGMCVIAGWGSTESGHLSQDLLKAEVPIVPKSLCEAQVDRDYFDTNTQICAGYEDGGADTCVGK